MYFFQHNFTKKTNTIIMKKFLKISLITILCFAFMILIFGAIVLSNAIKVSKDVVFDKNLLISASSQIVFYNNDNEIITKNLSNKIVDYENLPEFVKNAFISIEDKQFYSHKGINYKRIVKSMLNNIKSGYIKEGGSTISQQLIKNTHLNPEKTFDRKIKEIVLTKKLEKTFSKDDILETYLNVIYFGNNSYGLENASLNYFSKHSKDLSLNEAAVLAGLIKAPTKYSPILNYENCFQRKNLVLNQMYKDSYITKEELDENLNKEITLSLKAKSEKNIYEDATIKEAERILNLSEREMKINGIKIYTYLDENLQKELIEIANNEKFYHKNRYGNTADSGLVVIDNETGGINAFYGKCDYNLVDIKRQPGSTIKPILVYSPALDKNLIMPESQILDEKININGYSPHNVGNVYHGYVSITEAIEQSLNIPAVKIMEKVGIDNCKNYVKNVGLDLKNEGDNYALALGGFKYGTNLIELCNTFVPFSQEGNFKQASFIKEIRGLNDKILYKNPQKETKVMKESTSYLMTKMLISGVEKGTSMRLNSLPFKVAGKTGTVGITNTNLNTDVYSVAYTKDKTCGVWLGNAKGQSEYNLEGSNNGGTYCSSMLKEVFLKLYANKKPKEFDSAPNNIERVNIDEVSLETEHALKLAGENTPPVYKRQIEICKDFKLQKSENYTNPKAPEIIVKIENGKTKIVFNAQKHLIYKIFRTEEDQTKCLSTIKNKRGEIVFFDENIDYDTFYDYYVECYAYNYSTFTPSAKARSEVKKIILL